MKKIFKNEIKCISPYSEITDVKPITNEMWCVYVDDKGNYYCERIVAYVKISQSPYDHKDLENGSWELQLERDECWSIASIDSYGCINDCGDKLLRGIIYGEPTKGKISECIEHHEGVNGRDYGCIYGRINELKGEITK